jgi:hypothetical protein
MAMMVSLMTDSGKVIVLLLCLFRGVFYCGVAVAGYVSGADFHCRVLYASLLLSRTHYYALPGLLLPVSVMVGMTTLLCLRRCHGARVIRI